MEVNRDNQNINVTVNEIFGTGVKSFTQTKLSEESHGENEVSVVLTNGATFTFKFYNGEKGEQDFVKDSSNNKFRSTLDVIGLSVENTWQIPTSERTSETGDTSKTLPILEILREAYRGKMDLELGSNPFADGSGKKFLWIAWAANGVNMSNYIDFSAIN